MYTNQEEAYLMSLVEAEKSRKNIILTDDFKELRGNYYLRNAVVFSVENGFLTIRNNNGMLSPLSELKKIVEYLSHTIDSFNEELSIQEAVQERELELEQYKNRDIKAEKKARKIKSFVYLMLGESGKYKIGTSKAPKRRLKELRLASSENIILVGTIEILDAYKIEKEIHDLFIDKKSHSEWFSLTNNDIRTIKKLYDFKDVK